MKRVLVPVALGMVAMYLALAVGAAGCLVDPAGSSAPAHHHHSHVTHSAFCAWACQANPTVSLPVQVPPAVVFQFVALLVLLRASTPLHAVTHSLHSRAPPR